MRGRLLITGAAGNLGSRLVRRLLPSGRALRLLIHRRELPAEITNHRNVAVHRGDLAIPESLTGAGAGVDCIVHFAGVLFRPRPEEFLPHTNLQYFKNLMDVALQNGAGKVILISFPQVEGETTPDHPAVGRLDGKPTSVHARTRLEEERYLFAACEGTGTVPVSLRAGMVYGQGILMIEAARWLLKHRLLGVWRKPTWAHLISLDDFLAATQAAIEKESVAGIYHLGDEQPLYLQEFLDLLADHWGYARAWRLPVPLIHVAAWGCEAFATIFRTPSPLTRDFIRIGMASCCGDTPRMREELVPQLRYPGIQDGIGVL